MLDPFFWGIAALATVLLCTAHLCIGFVIGRKTASQDVLQRTREVLSHELEQSKSHELVADRLFKDVERVAAASHSLSGSVGRSVEAALRDILKATSNLRGALHEGTAFRTDALKSISNRESWQARRNGSKRALSMTGLVLEHDESINDSHSGSGPQRGAVRSHATPISSRRGPPAALAAEDIEKLRTSDDPTRQGQRDDTRYPYCLPQFVAEVHGSAFPDPARFFQVICRDISRAGISFFVPEIPASADLIVTIGTPPDLKFIKVEVTNNRPTLFEGEAGYTIGCAFCARLDSSIYCWDAERGAVSMPKRAASTSDDERPE